MGRRAAEGLLEELRSLADTRRYMAPREPTPPDPALVKSFEKANAAFLAAKRVHDDLIRKIHPHDRAEAESAIRHDSARAAHVEAARDLLRKHSIIKSPGEINLDPPQPTPPPPPRREVVATLNGTPLVTI